MKKEPSYYGIIPASVRYDNELPPRAKILYSEITALSNKEGYCFASNGYFAKLYDVKEGSISRLLSKLSKRDHIRIEVTKNQEGTNRKIYPFNKIVQGGTQNCVTGITKKGNPFNKIVQHNTKENNKDNNNTLSIGQIKDLQREREELKAQLRELTEKQAKPKRKRFSPPSIEQITEHFKEKGSDQAEAEVFFNHYESNGWKVGKNKMANWKAAATNWVKRNSKTHKPRTKNLVQRYVDYLNSHIENKILRKEHKKYESLYLIAAKDETVRQINNFKSKLDITNPTYTDCFVFDITYGTLAKRAGTKPDRRMGEFKQFYNTLSDYNKNKGILRKLFKTYLIKKFG